MSNMCNSVFTCVPTNVASLVVGNINRFIRATLEETRINAEVKETGRNKVVEEDDKRNQGTHVDVKTKHLRTPYIQLQISLP